ncbi:rho GTPase activating protein at 68F isoform X3 [Dermacentor variabilis]|uniref:rho GTPase activating protein at 68F isoform X3 n=1 Tax=Dermacentor variabilis TaxID=34621 RepID=UPI003F5C19A1
MSQQDASGTHGTLPIKAAEPNLAVHLDLRDTTSSASARSGAAANGRYCSSSSKGGSSPEYLDSSPSLSESLLDDNNYEAVLGLDLEPPPELFPPDEGRRQLEDFNDIECHGIVDIAGDDAYGRNVIVISACRLPPHKELNHPKFLRYLMHTLDQFVESDYTLVYFHHGLNSKNKPSLGWLWTAFRAFDRKEAVLDELHLGHPGIVRSKELARSYVWWPSIDADLETKVRSCQACQEQRNDPAKAPLHPWSWPTAPWRFGVLETVVSDNGPQLVSEDFKAFMRNVGARHVVSAPYHPSTNGLAERFVQTLKSALRKSSPGESIEETLHNFLLAYRNTPHPTTGEAPAYLLMGRRLHTRLDAMKPTVEGKVMHSQFTQMQQRRSNRDCFCVNDSVLVRNYRGPTKSVCGIVLKKTGPVSYKVMVTTPRGKFIWRRHLDQLLAGAGPMVIPRASDSDFAEGFLVFPEGQTGDRPAPEEPIPSSSRSSIRDIGFAQALPVKTTPSTRAILSHSLTIV